MLKLTGIVSTKGAVMSLHLRFFRSRLTMREPAQINNRQVRILKRLRPAIIFDAAGKDIFGLGK